MTLRERAIYTLLLALVASAMGAVIGIAGVAASSTTGFGETARFPTDQANSPTGRWIPVATVQGQAGPYLEVADRWRELPDVDEGDSSEVFVPESYLIFCAGVRQLPKGCAEMAIAAAAAADRAAGEYRWRPKFRIVMQLLFQSLSQLGSGNSPDSSDFTRVSGGVRLRLVAVFDNAKLGISTTTFPLRRDDFDLTVDPVEVFRAAAASAVPRSEVASTIDVPIESWEDANALLLRGDPG
jgi:hypothetical protein